jgi:hypothetical protein
MKAGDLVKYRRGAVNAGVGIVITNRSIAHGVWSILWSNGELEAVSVRNLKVINESR